MSEIVKGEESQKDFDIKLIKRLLKYTKPFIGILILCIITIFLSSIADISRPYLMKIAIDDYINGDKAPMVVMTKSPADMPYVSYNNKYYVRQKYVKHINDNYEKAQLISYKGENYLATGNISTDKYSIEKSGGSYIVKTPKDRFQALKLIKSDYKKFRQSDKNGVKKVSLIFLLILIAGFVFNYIQVYILNFVGQKIIFNMRVELFKHIEKLPLSFFDKNPVGKLVTRLTNDMENINEMFTNVIVTFLKDVFLLSFTIIMMLQLNARVALYCLSTIPLIVICAYFFRIKVRDAHREVKAKISKINSSLNENIMGMKVIHIFSREKYMFEEFDEINMDHQKSSMKELVIFAVFRPTMDLIYTLTLTILIWVAGKGVMQGVLQFGVLFAFVNYIEQFFNPIFDLSEKFNTLQSAMASSERVFQLLDTPLTIENKPDAEKIVKLKGEIEFKNVWFKYDKDWILKDVSFKITPGETVAFVGATGSGKTTIISLLSRLYDIQQGEILIDGKNIQDLDIHSLREKIGSVLQDVFLFTGTIKENIRLNEENISDENIEEICKFVNAHAFIQKLPHGYDEEVKERGSTLSSGQRQLLSFARALIFNPSVLILDEATSNIDTETESLIQDAISKVIHGRTNIVVAHRLSTIQNSDKIIVMHKGKIKEMGSHQDLLEKQGMYYNLYMLQYNGA